MSSDTEFSIHTVDAPADVRTLCSRHVRTDQGNDDTVGWGCGAKSMLSFSKFGQGGSNQALHGLEEGGEVGAGHRTTRYVSRFRDFYNQFSILAAGREHCMMTPSAQATRHINRHRRTLQALSRSFPDPQAPISPAGPGIRVSHRRNPKSGDVCLRNSRPQGNCYRLPREMVRPVWQWSCTGKLKKQLCPWVMPVAYTTSGVVNPMLTNN